MTTPRCLTCKHCYINFGSPGFSEMTPGDPGEWACRKDCWKVGYYHGKDDLVKAFAKGETCDKWESDGRAKP